MLPDVQTSGTTRSYDDVHHNPESMQLADSTNQSIMKRAIGVRVFPSFLTRLLSDDTFADNY